MAEALAKETGNPRDIFRRFDALTHQNDPSFESDFLRKYKLGSREREEILSGNLSFVGVKYMGEGSRKDEYKIAIQVGTSRDAIVREEKYNITLAPSGTRVVLLLDEAQ